MTKPNLGWKKPILDYNCYPKQREVILGTQEKKRKSETKADAIKEY